MAEVPISLAGRTDIYGNPLPATGTYIAPGGPAAGPAEFGGWAPYVPPEQAVGAPRQDVRPVAPGPVRGWDPYVPPPQQAMVADERMPITPEEAATRSLTQGFTFGAAPMIAGLSAASGMGPFPNTIAGAGQQLASPFVGAYNLSQFDPATGNINLTSDQGRVEAYKQGRQQALQQYQEIQKQYPWLTTGGEALGGLATVPFMGPFGELGATTGAGRIIQGAKVGGVTGGLFGAGEAGSRGETPGQVATEAGKGAVTGAVAGGALGGAIEGLTTAGGKVWSLLQGRYAPEVVAAKQLGELFKGRGRKPFQKAVQDVGAIKASWESKAPLTIADFGGRPAARLLRTTANVSPEASDDIMSRLNERFYDQNKRVTNWIWQKFGGKDTEEVRNKLIELARKYNEPAYTEAYLKGDREITNAKLQEFLSAPYVQDALKEAVKGWKNHRILDGFGAADPRFAIKDGELVDAATGARTSPNVQLWDYVARQLRMAADNAKPGSNEARMLNGYAIAILREVDAQVPEFQAAREGAARWFGARNALDAGRDFVSNDRMSNAEAARVVANMNPAEQRLFSQGFAGELARRVSEIGEHRNVALNKIFDSPAAKQRMDIALGPGGAEEFDSLMRIEGVMEKLRMAALGNSNSVGQMTDLLKGVGLSEVVHTLNPVTAMAGAFIIAARKMVSGINEEVATRLAGMLLSDDPAVFNRAMQIVSQNPAMRKVLSRAGDLTVRELESIFGPSGVGAGELAAVSRLRPRPEGEASPRQQDYQQEEQAGQGMVSPGGP
jgi:hypothetical protein